MRTLIVGGTGLTGAHASLYLKAAGHKVTLMSRNKPAIPGLQDFPHISHNYIDQPIAPETLSQFDSIVFAAGADLRLLPPDESEESFFERANVQSIPRFFAAARAAGVSRAVLIGSYYPQVAPEKIATNVYVRSRHLSDQAVRALNTATFSVCSLNAPFILGHVPGIDVPHLRALVQYAAGKLAGIPLIAPAGGVNHISSQSMSEAVLAALLKGEPGMSYLVGDENLSWKRYLEFFCQQAGNPHDLDVTTGEHPLFPDAMMYAGRNATVSYEPDTSVLNYSRGNIRAAIKEVVTAYL